MKNRMISELFMNLGVQPNLRGFEYLRYMLAIYKPGDYVTKYLYPVCAKKFGTTAKAVERAARHAIERMALIGSVNDMHNVFGFTVNPETGVPSVSLFLACCYVYLMDRMEDED